MVATDCAKNSCLSRNSCFQGLVSLWTLFSHQRRENTTGLQSLQLCRTLDIQEKTQESLQVVSFLVFLPENHPDVFCTPVCCHDVIAIKMMPPSGRAHPQVYCVQIWSKSDQRFLRYWHFCIIPLSLKFLLFWPLSAPEAWPQIQHQCHNNSFPSLPGHYRCHC